MGEALLKDSLMKKKRFSTPNNQSQKNASSLLSPIEKLQNHFTKFTVMVETLLFLMVRFFVVLKKIS